MFVCTYVQTNFFRKMSEENHPEPMKFVATLQENMLAQDITFSIQHPNEAIRNKAKQKALESIDKLKSSGIDNALIFYMICTSVTMMYVTGSLSLLEHRTLMGEYMERVFSDDKERAENLMRQMIVEMAVVKAKASPQTNNIIEQVRQSIQNMNVQ